MPALSKSDEFNQTAFNPLTSKTSTPKNNDFNQPDDTKKRNQFPSLSSRNGKYFEKSQIGRLISGLELSGNDPP